MARPRRSNLAPRPIAPDRLNSVSASLTSSCSHTRTTAHPTSARQCAVGVRVTKLGFDRSSTSTTGCWCVVASHVLRSRARSSHPRRPPVLPSRRRRRSCADCSPAPSRERGIATLGCAAPPQRNFWGGVPSGKRRHPAREHGVWSDPMRLRVRASWALRGSHATPPHPSA